MLNLEQIGAGKNWLLKKSLKENSFIENVLKESFDTSNLIYETKSFWEGYPNDEKIYSWPTISIDSVAIQRFPFKHYHTSEDTPKIIKKKYIKESYKVCSLFVEILEKDYIPKYKNFLPPWLTKRNLYFDFHNDKKKYNLCNDLLYAIDGKTTILNISQNFNLNFFTVFDYLEKFYNQGIVEKK